MVVVPAAIHQRSTSTSGRCCRRPSRPKPPPWAALSPLLASRVAAAVERGRAPLASRLAPPSPRSHRWWCRPSCWTATQRWATPSPPADSTRPTTSPPSYREQSWVPTALCRAAWPSRTPLSMPPPSGPRTLGLFSFRCPRRSPSCHPPSPPCACRPRTGAPSVTPPSAWPRTWFTTCDPTTKRSTPWSLWWSGGVKRNSSAPFATSPSGSGITCHVIWPPITDFYRLRREGLFFNKEGLWPCLNLSSLTGDRPLQNTRTPLALVFTLDSSNSFSVCLLLLPCTKCHVLGVCKCVSTSKWIYLWST